MVDIARCRTCGSKMSQVWGARENCVDCGGPVDQVNVDMGGLDRVPRYLNVGGIALTIFAVLYLIYELARDQMGRSQGTTVIGLFLIGILMFAASLTFQFQLASMAKERTGDKPETRRQRRVRTREGEGEANIRSGRMETPPRRTASKVLVRRR